MTHLRGYRAGFDVPARLAADPSGNIYVTDPARGRIVVRAPSGRVVSTHDGLGRPISIAVASGGRIYVGDGASGSVTAFGSDWQPRFQVGRGIGEFQFPNDLAIDPATGNLYVADSDAHLVKVYSGTGGFLQSFGGQGSAAGQFNFPAAVFVDAAARQVLVADQRNSRVAIFDVTGNFVSCIGHKGSDAGGFNLPQGVAVDPQGRVLVADSFEGRIQVVDRNGDFIAYISDFGAAPGQLRIPMGMVIDASNRLFVAAANNARLEMFGMDAFADPETVVPATVDVEPDRLERATPTAAVVVYVEVAGYPLDQISHLVANGVAAVAPPRVGDRDGNGVPDLRAEFDWTSLLATLPAEGVGVVTVGGRLGAMQLDGSDTVPVTLCGPRAICPLGDADPQCNTAVCRAPLGCTIQPRADGAGCEDGDACTVEDTCSAGACVGAVLTCNDGNPCTDDSCDPVGGCVATNTTAPCDDGNACTTDDACAGGVCDGAAQLCDDANPCTDDTCDPALGCLFLTNAAPCDDGCACTIGDVCAGGVCAGGRSCCDDGNVCTEDFCSPLSGCMHAARTIACDDGDPGTVGDACDGASRCTGQEATGQYALLSWPSNSWTRAFVVLDAHVRVRGNLCAAVVRGGSFDRIEGDVVAWAVDWRAVAFQWGSHITGDVVTGGGAIEGLDRMTVDGRIDRSGAAAELAECAAARARAAQRRAQLAALDPTPGFTPNDVRLERGTSRRLPVANGPGSGPIVIDIAALRLEPFSTLTLVGADTSEVVIVRIRGRLSVGRAARIDAEGLPPERVIFVVDGSVNLWSEASVTGSVFTMGRVRMGRASRVAGAVLGSTIRLARSATVELHPFAAWTSEP